MWIRPWGSEPRHKQLCGSGPRTQDHRRPSVPLNAEPSDPEPQRARSSATAGKLEAALMMMEKVWWTKGWSQGRLCPVIWCALLVWAVLLTVCVWVGKLQWWGEEGACGLWRLSSNTWVETACADCLIHWLYSKLAELPTCLSWSSRYRFTTVTQSDSLLCTCFTTVDVQSGGGGSATGSHIIPSPPCGKNLQLQHETSSVRHLDLMQVMWCQLTSLCI